MVGRELPNVRPNGEDHRGAVGGDTRSALALYKIYGVMEDALWRNLIQGMILIHKALV